MSMTLAVAEAAQNIVYLAGVSGDGTSNGAITSLVNRVLGAVSVAAVAIFAVRAGMTFAKAKGAEGHKDLMHIGGQFVVVMILIFGAWALARIGASLAGGAFS